MRLRPSFTFLETVVVLAIIGIMAAIAIPRYAGALTNQHIEAAARRIVVDLARAQRKAKASSASQSVLFSVEDNSYTLPGVADMDHSGSVYTVELSQPPYEATLLSADFDGTQEMIYDGYGIPLDGVGGSVLIQVGSLFKTITVDGETAAVSVQ